MDRYDQGGWLTPGFGMARNDTDRPEPVILSGPAAEQVKWGIEYIRRTYGCRD